MDSKRATANIKNVQSQLSKLEQKATSKTLINNLTLYQRELATVDKNLNELVNAKLEGSEFESQIQELIEHKQRIEQAAKNTLIEAEVDRVRRTYETKIKGAKFSDKDAAVLEGSFNDLKQKHPESNVVEQFIQEARIAIADKLGVSAPQPSASTVSAVTTTTTSTPLVAAKKETPIATATSSPAVQPVLGSEAFFKNAAIAKIESQLDSAQNSASKPTSTAESALERAKGYLKDAQAKLSSEIEQFNYLDHFNQRYTAIRQQIAVTHAEKDLSAVEKKLVQAEQKVSKSLGSATFDKVIRDYDVLISEVKDKKDTFSAIESQWQQLVEKHEQLSVQFQQKNKDVTADQQQEEQLKFARSAIAHLESSLEIGKKETVDGSFPASIRVDFFSWARYNVSDAIGSSETKDYNVFTNIIHNCEVMERMNIEGTASELQALKDEAAKCHAMHCTQVCLTKQSDEYLQYLARFPKTRAYVLKRLREEIRYKQFAKAIHMLQTDKKYNFSDPVKTQPASLVDEPDNIEEWLKTDYKTVTPNSVNGQCGYMSFANALIPKNNSARQAEQTFTLGKDTHIYARCFWPQKINEIPIAYGPNNNLMQPPATLSPVFLHMELLLFLTVDGKRFERLDLPKKALAYMVEDSGRENSFYNDATTCQFGCFVSDLKLSGFIEDEWDLIPYRLTKLFSMLSAGNHKIEFDLCYRLVTHNYKVFPGFDTACSEPIAKGGFNLVIPNANAIQLADPVPTTTKTSSQLAYEDAQEAEKAIVDFLKQSAEWGSRADRTETIVSVQVTGTYTPVFERRIVGDRVVDVLVQYTLPFTLVSYRSPKKGWNRESVAVFELNAHTPRIDNVAPKIPPIAHVSVSVGASIDFDGEGVLPDNILHKYNLRDASLDENERRGFNPADLPANF